MDLLKKTYYLTEMHAEGLYALSLKQKVSQSEVVRRAIEKYIDRIAYRHHRGRIHLGWKQRDERNSRQ